MPKVWVGSGADICTETSPGFTLPCILSSGCPCSRHRGRAKCHASASSRESFPRHKRKKRRKKKHGRSEAEWKLQPRRRDTSHRRKKRGLGVVRKGGLWAPSHPRTGLRASPKVPTGRRHLPCLVTLQAPRISPLRPEQRQSGAPDPFLYVFLYLRCNSRAPIGRCESTVRRNVCSCVPQRRHMHPGLSSPHSPSLPRVYNTLGPQMPFRARTRCKVCHPPPSLLPK